MAEPREGVILLHGLARTSRSLRKLERHLADSPIHEDHCPMLVTSFLWWTGVSTFQQSRRGIYPLAALILEDAQPMI